MSILPYITCQKSFPYPPENPISFKGFEVDNVSTNIRSSSSLEQIMSTHSLRTPLKPKVLGPSHINLLQPFNPPFVQALYLSQSPYFQDLLYQICLWPTGTLESKRQDTIDSLMAKASTSGLEISITTTTCLPPHNLRIHSVEFHHDFYHIIVDVLQGWVPILLLIRVGERGIKYWYYKGGGGGVEEEHEIKLTH